MNGLSIYRFSEEERPLMEAIFLASPHLKTMIKNAKLVEDLTNPYLSLSFNLATEHNDQLSLVLILRELKRRNGSLKEETIDLLYNNGLERIAMKERIMPTKNYLQYQIDVGKMGDVLKNAILADWNSLVSLLLRMNAPIVANDFELAINNKGILEMLFAKGSFPPSDFLENITDPEIMELFKQVYE